jgi:hypothetical protein
MEDDRNFNITVTLEKADQATLLEVNHFDETFGVQLQGKTIVILNNGDNSWSLVSGEIDQLDVNIIGQAIEQFYKDAGW